MIKLLLIEDDVTFGSMIKKFLIKNQFDVALVNSGQAAIDFLVSNPSIDIVLSDVRLPDFDGVDLLSILLNINPDLNIIMMTSYANVASAVNALKKGAVDYISKPFTTDDLLKVLSQVKNENNLSSSATESLKVEKITPKSQKNDLFIGTSHASEVLMKQIEMVAPTNYSVLISGESGSGKEVYARKIHELSARKDQVFIAVDCGAIPKEIAASEFFGHVKGSFTGAIENKKGHFEQANGGTLFLDEVGNMSYEHQINLLRAIQELKIKPIGSSKEIKIDVRIIAATNDHLKESIKKGTFREDLYHRLNDFSLQIPALRDREEDIKSLAAYFLDFYASQLNKSIAGFSQEVIQFFYQYKWPGNIRELQNVIKRAVLLTSSNMVEMNVIPSDLWDSNSDTSLDGLQKDVVEKKMIEKALVITKGNKTDAAKLLNMSRKTLYNKLKLYQINE
jgi:two-component system, NtrC family, response regulator HydG